MNENYKLTKGVLLDTELDENDWDGLIKDFKSVELLAHRKDLNMFWHNNDEMVFTTQGNIWCYPGNNIIHPKSIWLCLNDTTIPTDIPDIYGICIDKMKT